MPPTDVLVFGEDDNDRKAIIHLIRALSDSKAKITPHKKPIILDRGACKKKRAKMVEEIANFAKAYEKAGRGVAVIVHRDCDAVEPAHVELAKSLQEQLSAAGVRSLVAATPAWEIESWWMLFPKAIEKVCTCWKKVNYGSQWVGKFANAKEKLIRDLRPSATRKCRDFCEADGVKIAKVVSEDPSISARLRQNRIHLRPSKLVWNLYSKVEDKLGGSVVGPQSELET
jgi:hypothetical protein